MASPGTVPTEARVRHPAASPDGARNAGWALFACQQAGASQTPCHLPTIAGRAPWHQQLTPHHGHLSCARPECLGSQLFRAGLAGPGQDITCLPSSFFYLFGIPGIISHISEPGPGTMTWPNQLRPKSHLSKVRFTTLATEQAEAG